MNVLPSTYGCTAGAFTYDNNGETAAIVFRTFDMLGKAEPGGKLTELDVKGVIIPSETNGEPLAYQSSAPDGSVGVQWQAKYGIVGFTCLDMMKEPVAGQNIAGLAFHANTLTTTKYQEVPPDQLQKALRVEQIGLWILSQFATCDEVTEALNDVYVWGDGMGPTDFAPRVHFFVADKYGARVGIEYINGELKTYPNVNMVTNDPPLNAQELNLRNYHNLNPYPLPAENVDGQEMPASFGCGMLGLPGDDSPVSRYVRGAKFIQFALPSTTAEESRRLAGELVGRMVVIKGMARQPDPKASDTVLYDSTEWAMINDIYNNVMAWWTPQQQRWQSIDMSKIDFSGKTPYKPIEIYRPDASMFIDVTDTLQTAAKGWWPFS